MDYRRHFVDFLTHLRDRAELSSKVIAEQLAGKGLSYTPAAVRSWFCGTMPPPNVLSALLESLNATHAESEYARALLFLVPQKRQAA